jgi:DNA polymerase III subunit gamma/tau
MKIERLTKKYKIKFLSDIVGQDLSIQFLRNSLYKKHICPLYIFSGMRGTGKTTTARIFSASCLCDAFEDQETDIPCYKCKSCKIFQDNRHPDIIELDAASNSGVETIRSLIENAHVMPAICDKKMYIIDEAHMLSKAAFNACLKIMEDPPEHVSFILATTEFNKVIDTIRSRALSLYFSPVETQDMVKYINKICSEENIKLSGKSIELISEYSEGSIRDSLNLLEKLKMIDDNLIENHLENELGFCELSLVNNFLESVTRSDKDLYLEFKKKFSKNHRAHKNFWIRTMNTLQERLEMGFINKDKYDPKIISVTKFLYSYEEMFLKSIDPTGILDICFFTFQALNSKKESGQKNNSNVSIPEETSKCNIAINKEDNTKQSEVKNIENNNLEDNSWDRFVKSTFEEDKSLGAIFNQCQVDINKDSNTVTCSFKKSLSFYKHFINDKKELWKRHFEKIFKNNFKMEIIFNVKSENIKKEASQNTKHVEIYDEDFLQKYKKKKIFSENPDKPSISDKSISTTIKKLFPGKTSFVGTFKNETKKNKMSTG